MLLSLYEPRYLWSGDAAACCRLQQGLQVNEQTDRWRLQLYVSLSSLISALDYAAIVLVSSFAMVVTLNQKRIGVISLIIEKLILSIFCFFFFIFFLFVVVFLVLFSFVFFWRV